MSNYSNSLPIIEGIYDIQPPAVPALSLLETSLLVLLFSSLLIIIFYIFWKNLFSKKTIAKRNLKKLQYKYHNNDISQHDAVYQLCQITKNGLKLKNINKEACLPKKLLLRQKQWHQFIDHISDLRYKENNEKNVNIDKLFMDVLFWLKVWP